MKKLEFKLALSNIKNNKLIYIPYIFASSVFVYIYLLLLNLDGAEFIKESEGSRTIFMVLGFGTWIIMVFAVLFLLYINSVLRKSRLGDLALYSMIGVSKKSIGKVIAIETFLTAIISMIIGIVTEIITYPLVLRMVVKILDVKAVDVFSVNKFFIFETVRIFLIIHLVLGFINIISTRKLNPIELMQKSREGEKEPRANIIGIVIGMALLIFGYYQALSTDSIFTSIKIFFVAVIAVIIGTFFLFGSISVIILKALKKNKRVYYKEKNMNFISGLLFRVRQSSASLASICIISTMFLVVFTCLTGMLKSRDVFLEDAFPADYNISYYAFDDQLEKDIEGELQKLSKETNMPIKDIKSVKTIKFETKSEKENFTPKLYVDGLEQKMEDNTDLISVVDIEEMNKISEEKYELNDGEVLIYSNKKKTFENFHMGDLNFKVRNLEEKPKYISDPAQGLFHNLIIVTKDTKAFTDEIDKLIKDHEDNGSYHKFTEIFIDLVDNKNVKSSFYNGIGEHIVVGQIDGKYEASFGNGIASRQEFKEIYSGIYIVSTLLSIIFIITTSIIIFYKQISEGIEDGKNISIMKKIGMSNRQIKNQVGRQNFFMFFAPLIVAFCHTMGASKIVFDIVKIVGVMDKTTFIKSTAIGMGIYLVVYFVMFKLSTVVYLKMAKRYENR